MNWQKMQAIDRKWLYMVLIISLSITLLAIKATIPVFPDPSSKDLYREILASDPNKPVFLQSDWTQSTRGESRAHFQALIRMLMVNERKFVFYSVADPQAPQVARDVIRAINEERKEQGLRQYSEWDDYLDIGLFPNAENSLNAFGNNLRSAWGGRRARTPDGAMDDIFNSPVLQGVNRIEDCGLYVVITASNSIDIAVQRISQRVKLTAMVTGVVGPTVLPYYRSGQVRGMAVGLKGAYDMEYMMEYGLNIANEEGVITVPYPENPTASAPPITEGTTFGQGQQYYMALHVALVLMILAIVLGNIAMFATKKKEGNRR